jgi:hypothetical protein
MFRPALVLVISIVIASCDFGLTPVVQDPGFEGTIRIRSAWPPADSVQTFVVIAFRSYPPGNILEEVLSGRALYSEPLKKDTSVVHYRIQRADLMGSFSYVVVAQQYGPDIQANWKVVGVYTTTGDNTRPSPVDLAGGMYVKGVDMDVDFYNLPPQPF